jgi:two-component system, NarL family, response regulator DegU
MQMNKIKIIIVDDHPLFRQGVADSLSLEPDLSVVGQCSDGESALELIRTMQPSVAIIDVNMPGINGQQVTRLVVAEKLPTRIILLTAYDDEEQRIHAMSVGAAAYCTKDVEPERLIATVRSVAEGYYIVSDQILDGASLERWLTLKTADTYRLYGDPGDPYQPLSSREMEVLVHVTRGLSNKEIALLLGISHQTVKNHVTAILRKLGVEDRTQAAIYALRRGWVRLHPSKNDAQE